MERYIQNRMFMLTEPCSQQLHTLNLAFEQTVKSVSIFIIFIAALCGA